MDTIALFFLVALNTLSAVLGALVLYKYDRIRRPRGNVYYTDYRYGNLVMRVFKHEFEYQAIGDIHNGRILDSGTLSPLYDWALIEY